MPMAEVCFEIDLVTVEVSQTGQERQVCRNGRGERGEVSLTSIDL
jgi:hypothetical protein